MAEDRKKITIATEEEVARYASGADEAADSVAGGEGGEPVTPAAAADAAVDRVEAAPSLQTQLEAYQDKLLRAQAECANISKRLHQQHAASLKLAGMDLARALLPVVDSFERTLSNLSESSHDDPVVAGVKLVSDQLMKVLADYGVKVIEAVGKPFDPALHEAMMQDRETDAAVGMVTQELQRGYMMNERVLRPARVAVAGGDEESEGGAEEAQSGPDESGEGESTDADV